MMANAPIDLDKARKKARAKARAPDGTSPPSETEADHPCPVTALGHKDGKFWFLNVVGEKRELSDRQLGMRSPISGLFMGDMDWVMARFKATDADGNPKGWSVVKTMEYLMAACRRAGIYGDHVVLRQPGVWRGENGGVIAHCGDALFIDGEKHEPGQKFNEQIFVVAARQVHPARRPADAMVARGIGETIRQLWKLKHDGGEIIALGLVGQSYYAAALNWRANGFISGGTNSGKSKLLKLLMAMVPICHYTNETTKAGVEGALAGRAMPSFIDEGFDHGGAETLINIVLSASSGEGTKGHRGNADGTVRKIEVVGSAIMASINPPAMQPQHRSRFSMIELVRPEGGADHSAPMDAAIAAASEVGPALFARALAGFARFKAALGVFRQALGAAGCVAREMDHLGTILAGHWMLTEDGVPDEEAAAETVKIIANGFLLGAEEMVRDSAPQQVLAMLLSRVVNLDRSTDQESIARVLHNVFRPLDIPGDFERARSARRVLARWGIRPVRADEIYKNAENKLRVPRLGNGDGIWIDHRWQPLRGIFANTPYDGDRWFVELTRLEGAHMSHGAVRVSEISPSRALWIDYCDNVETNEEY